MKKNQHWKERQIKMKGPPQWFWNQKSLVKKSQLYFSNVCLEDVIKEMQNLNARKSTQNSDIPINVLKDN